MAAATTSAKQADPLGSVLYTVTESSTRADDISLDTTSGVIHCVEIDNTGNSSAAYLHLWDLAHGSVTVGTTNEDYTFMAPASTRISYSCPEGAGYTAALTAAIVATPGSDTGPGVLVTAYILVRT